MVALTLITGCGIFDTTAQAQSRSRHWDRDRDGRRDGNWQRDRDRNREWLRRQQIQRARLLELQRQRERERRAREYYRYRNQRNDGYYGGNYGGYSNGGYGYSNSEVERGYRNGLKEGQDDARDRDSFNPSRHSSFRDGNPSYREGFYRGYQTAYRQFARYRGW